MRDDMVTAARAWRCLGEPQPEGINAWDGVGGHLLEPNGACLSIEGLGISAIFYYNDRKHVTRSEEAALRWRWVAHALGSEEEALYVQNALWVQEYFGVFVQSQSPSARGARALLAKYVGADRAEKVFNFCRSQRYLPVPAPGWTLAGAEEVAGDIAQQFAGMSASIETRAARLSKWKPCKRRLELAERGVDIQKIRYQIRLHWREVEKEAAHRPR